jgi:hypothetical protein
MAAIRAYERPLAEWLVGGLMNIHGVTLYGSTDPAHFDRRAPTVAFTLEDTRRARWPNGWDGNYYTLAVTEPSEDSLRPPVGTCPKGGRQSNGAVGPGKYVCRKAPAGG